MDRFLNLDIENFSLFIDLVGANIPILPSEWVPSFGLFDKSGIAD